MATLHIDIQCRVLASQIFQVLVPFTLFDELLYYQSDN